LFSEVTVSFSIHSKKQTSSDILRKEHLLEKKIHIAKNGCNPDEIRRLLAEKESLHQQLAKV